MEYSDLIQTEWPTVSLDDRVVATRRYGIGWEGEIDAMGTLGWKHG